MTEQSGFAMLFVLMVGGLVVSVQVCWWLLRGLCGLVGWLWGCVVGWRVGRVRRRRLRKYLVGLS